MSGPKSLRRNAVRHFVLYAIDMLIAIAGWTVGFGLQVQNWPALIGLLLVSRWVFHVLQSGFYLRDAKEKAAEEREGGGA